MLSSHLSGPGTRGLQLACTIEDSTRWEQNGNVLFLKHQRTAATAGSELASACQQARLLRGRCALCQRSLSDSPAFSLVLFLTLIARHRATKHGTAAGPLLANLQGTGRAAIHNIIIIISYNTTVFWLTGCQQSATHTLLWSDSLRRFSCVQ